MHTANHILAKEGILTTFSIAKKINAKDVKRLKNKLKKSKAKPEELNELLRKSVIKDAQGSLMTQNVPGLIINEDDTPVIQTEEEQKRIMEFTYFASIIAKKLTDKNIGKYHSCYIINAIINMLKLTGEDFDEFHRKFGSSREENGENPGEFGDTGVE